MATNSLRFVLFSLLLITGGCAGGGSGGGGGGGPVTPPPTGPTAFTAQAGLACAVPGPGVIRADFTPPPSAGFEVAVFVSPTRSNLFATTPRVPAAGETQVTVTGLTDGDEHFIGLGIRPTTGGTYEEIGPVLTATPGAPMYVAFDSTAGSPDGNTPATAYRDMFTAALNAFARLSLAPDASINVWVKGGGYTISSTLPITAGVNVYGGFDDTFDLATRDIENNPTVWNVTAGQKAFDYGDQVNTGLKVIVDGVQITGNGVGLLAIDTDSTDACSLELRSVIVTDFVDRGLRIRNAGFLAFDTILTNCQSSRNGADGLSGSGPFDYIVYNCVFASNVQEGMDLDGLVPEAGGTATLDLRSSRFFGNGAEGLDCTMAAPLIPSNGAYSVQIRGCSFERNAMAGCLVDVDFELVSGYSADVQIQESTARGNAGFGFHLDLDGPLDTTREVTAFLHRVLATSNGSHGLYVTSESRPSFLTVSTSASIGNNGFGLLVEGPPGSAGNCAVSATHCLFAGNSAGGMSSRDIPGAASSCIAYLQDSPFGANVRQVADVATSSPGAIAFANAPVEYAHVTARSGATLTLAQAPGFPLGSKLELANDGTERSATSIAGNQVVLAAEPEDFGVPGILAAFPAGSGGVGEDWSLLAGSIAIGAGLGGLDAGPMGSAAPGAPGGVDDVPPELLGVATVSPAISATVDASQALVIRFSRPLDGGSANATTVRAVRGSTTLNVSLATAGATLTIDAPGGGWGAGDFRVELDGVRATDGTELSGSVVLPFSR